MSPITHMKKGRKCNEGERRVSTLMREHNMWQKTLRKLWLSFEKRAELDMRLANNHLHLIHIFNWQEELITV